jgi:hypothetical protein
MSQPQSNGAPRNVPAPIILPDGSELFRVSEDDPDTVVRTWPNCGPSDLAFPPKKDDVRGETPTEELLALMNAMTAYKSKRGLEYLLWDDVLDVLHNMGYRKVAPQAEVSAPARETTDP